MANDEWTRDKEAGRSAQLSNERVEMGKRMGMSGNEAAKKAVELKESDATRAKAIMAKDPRSYLSAAERSKTPEQDRAQRAFDEKDKKERDVAREAKYAQKRAELEKKMQGNRGRQSSAQSALAGKKFQELPKPSPSQRLGGGRNVGAQRGKGATPKQDEKEKGLPKLGGTFWWLLLGLMIASDIGCILFNLLVLGGVGIAGAGSALTLGIGAIAAIPLGGSIAAVGWAGGVLLSLNAFMFSMGYYLMNHIPLLEARKLATLGVNAIIKLFPGLNAFPTLTISFIAITIMENMKRGKGIFGGVVGTVAQSAIAKTGPVGAVAGKVLSKA